ncbi:MAG TPA: hypothetical protein VHB30_13290, partial [Solirubrobacteraceae bacterium]|nr:hypothetical protein [Solirubrobacteraceae bacterium]
MDVHAHRNRPRLRSVAALGLAAACALLAVPPGAGAATTGGAGVGGLGGEGSGGGVYGKAIHRAASKRSPAHASLRIVTPRRKY